MGDTVAQQDAAGGKADQQHEDSQHQGTGPGQHLPGFIRAAGELVHHHRYRGHRLEDVVVPVLVAEGGEQQRCGLAGDAGQRQQDAGDDAGRGTAVQHLHDHFPLRDTQRQRRLTHLRGHQAEHLVGGAHHHRQHDEGQRQCTGERREVAAGLHHVQGVDEQTKHDGRRRQQDVVDEADHGAGLAGVAVLGQPGAGQHAQRGADADCQRTHHRTAEEGIGKAAFLHRRRRHLGEQIQVDAGKALGGQGEQDPAQEEQAEQGGGAGRGNGDDIADAAAQIQRISGAGHQLPSLRDRRISIRRAMASTTKVTMKRTKPSSSRAER